jgi:type II secretory pathway component GspD/PulD (secretin)
MDVAPQISALTGDTVPVQAGVNAPVFAMRSAQSRVAVRNDHTVVIGGLMEDRLTETTDKVPIVGDIPIVGAAFRRVQHKKTKTE